MTLATVEVLGAAVGVDISQIQVESKVAGSVKLTLLMNTLDRWTTKAAVTKAKAHNLKKLLQDKTKTLIKSMQVGTSVGDLDRQQEREKEEWEKFERLTKLGKELRANVCKQLGLGVGAEVEKRKKAEADLADLLALEQQLKAVEEKRIMEEREQQRQQAEWETRMKEAEAKVMAAAEEKEIERQEGFQAALNVAMKKRLKEMEEKVAESDHKIQVALEAQQAAEEEQARLALKNLELKKSRPPISMEKTQMHQEHAFMRYVVPVPIS